MATAAGQSESGASPASVLPPRRETALARYPRWLKLAGLGTVLGLGAALAVLMPRHHPAGEAKDQPGPVERQAAQPFPSPAGSGEQTAAQFPALNDQNDKTLPMPAAPDPDVTEETPHGQLPKIGSGGRPPWQVYARPFDQADRRPRIAIVIADLGLSRVASDAAIARLPAAVTLAFDAQSQNAGAWLARARTDGHETLLAVPMEPQDYPQSDPGGGTLLTGLPNADNIQRLRQALMTGAGYVGITTLTGSRFLTEAEKLEPIFQTLQDRGLLFFDAQVAPRSAVPALTAKMKLPVVGAGASLDADPSPEAIDLALAELERKARTDGQAVGFATSLPVAIDRIASWSATLPAHGIALAPVSAMVSQDKKPAE